MKLFKIVILCLIVTINYALLYNHINNTYYNYYNDSINSTIVNNNMYVIMEYNEKHHALGETICTNDDEIQCSINIKNYLMKTNFMKDNEYNNMMFSPMTPNISPSNTYSTFSNLFVTTKFLLIINIVCIYIFLLLKIASKYTNNKMIYNCIIATLSCSLITTIFTSPFFWYYNHYCSSIVNNGYKAGAEMYGLNYNGTISTPYIHCNNNIDCFNEMVKLSQIPYSDGYVVINKVYKYETAVDLVPIFLPIISELVIIYLYIKQKKNKVLHPEETGLMSNI